MEYIICSVCGCVYGGKDSMSAIYDGWCWKSGKWFCPTHRPKGD